ncbi:cyclophilin-like fold protein [Rhodococcus sp. IEGM 1379]|uniref:cyclophilin-like fold protein n=1 Tax=Rhodococcus sp. IEGM 1379 TaxID=3047086 RepID=UPI0024B844FA|nr:cyclophilin-like fold protein [Rhodococcus sp. IEGM 1379]MDI9917368.1 cyclophilin-like fold protein [Rhodococcus sp. IEGM 1379]
MRQKLVIAGTAAIVFAVTGCTTSVEHSTPNLTIPAATTSLPSSASSSADPAIEVGKVEGTVVRFTSGDTAVDVTIESDNPTTRDFLAMLPLTLSVEEFAGREKVSRLPRELETDRSPGSDPENGDLIYYAPWGSLGFYYDADGIGYADQTIHLGTYDAAAAQLSRLEGGNVTAEVIHQQYRVHPTMR